MSYVYIRTQAPGDPPLWTVGFYTPAGIWMPESDHENEELAAYRIHYLNGGSGDIAGSLASIAKTLRSIHEIYRARRP